MVRLCAEAMGLTGHPVSDGHDEAGIQMIWTTEGWEKNKNGLVIHGNQEQTEIYNPLRDDAQAMALVKRFKLNIGQLSCYGSDLNRTIVEYVANIQKSKETK